MPGFVDVSNMSDLEIKRLCQADEDNTVDQPRYQYRNAMATKQYTTDAVLAAAFYAWDKNGKQIVRDDRPAFEDRPAQSANRTFMTQALNGPDSIIDPYLSRVNEAREYLQQTIMVLMLKGTTVNDFLTKINDLAQRDSVTSRDIGMLAWFPKLVTDFQSKDEVRSSMARLENASQYIGRLGEKVTVKFTVIEQRYVPSINCFAVYGQNDNDNLVFFWARSQKQIPDTAVTIQGKVKEHKLDNRRNNARVTVLNYVKIV